MEPAGKSQDLHLKTVPGTCVHSGVESTDMQKPWVSSVIPVTHSSD